MNKTFVRVFINLVSLSKYTDKVLVHVLTETHGKHWSLNIIIII